MDDIRFERHFRTPYSESYYIMQGTSLQTNNRLGTVDIHFTTTAVHGTLILERELDESDLTKLIEQIGAAVQIQLIHNMRAVCIHRFGADHQSFGDLVVGEALRHQFQDFAFALRQTAIAIFLLAGMYPL